MRRAWFVITSLVLSTSASAFTEIPVREERDGAGPSHIFHLQDDHVAVIDPLDAKVIAFRICGPNRACDNATAETSRIEREFPSGARLRRLIRQPDRITLISEDESQQLVVPRDVSRWPARFDLKPYARMEPDLKAPPVRRNTSDRLTFPARNGRPALSVRTLGPNYLASARELEQDADGRRYVLWKEFSFRDSQPFDARSRRIHVDVYVGRFDKNGVLSGIATIPRDRMTRIGFEYVTVLPGGSVLLLASIDKARFEITERALSAPDKLTVATFQSRKPATAWAVPPPPEQVGVIAEPGERRVGGGTDEGSSSAPADREWTGGFVSRAELRAAMDAFRDERWSPSDDNLRNPCKEEIVPGWGIDCRHENRFVRPPQFVRKPYASPQVGVPYDWGGGDSVKTFEKRLAEGYVAGNIGGTFWANRRHRATTGVDCSGFVSNVWRLGRHVATAYLDGVSTPLLTLERLRVGDALLLAGHHVVLYREQVLVDGASLAIRVTEATSRCGAVCDSVYEIDFFHDFTLRRRNK
jgi:hypothetical protein